MANNYQYAQNAPQPEQNIIQGKLDREAMEIFNTVHPELKGAFISIAIKHFKDNDLYLKFFADKNLLPEEDIKKIEEIEENNFIEKINNEVNQVDQVNSQPQTIQS